MGIPIAKQKFNGLLAEIYKSEKAFSINKGFQCMETLDVNLYIAAQEELSTFLNPSYLQQEDMKTQSHGAFWGKLLV